MSKDTATPTRRAGAQLDMETGHVSYSWQLSPASQTDPVELRLPPPPDSIPIYPLRYGVADQKLSAPHVADSGYGSMDNGKHFGLRAMRPGSYVYVLYREAGQAKACGFLATANGMFAQITPDEVDPSLNLPRDDTANLATVSAALPYVLAPFPASDNEVEEQAWLLACDTLLTQATLDKLTGNADGLRDQLATPISLKAGCEQPQTFNPEQLKTNVAELADQSVPRRQAVKWSESQPDTPRGNQIATMMARGKKPVHDCHPMAVVIHDIGGALSELNWLLSQALTARAEYSEQAARKLMVSDMIDQLASNVARRTELDAFNNDAIGSAIGGASGGAANAARDRAYRAGLEAKVEPLGYVREDERQAFLKAHPGKMQELQSAVDGAAAEVRKLYLVQGQRYKATVALYDCTDIGSYLDLRKFGANTLCGLVHDTRGLNQLANEAGEDGPTGTLKQVLLGHADIASYVATFAGPVAAGAGHVANETAGHTAGALEAVLKKIGVDGASEQLSLMTATVVARIQLAKPDDFAASRYRPIMEVLEGRHLTQAQMTFTEFAQRLRDEAGLSGRGEFRAASIDIHASVNVYQLAEIDAVADEEAHRLTQRLSFWDNTRLGIGGLGVLVSAYNAQKATRDLLNSEEGAVLTNALNVGGSLLVGGSAGTVVGQVGYERLRNRSTAAGQQAAADAFDAKALQFEKWSVALAAGAATLMAFKSTIDAIKATGEARALAAADAMVEAGAAGVGTLYLAGKFYPAQMINMLRVGGTVARVGRAAFAVARLGAGPVGWILLAAEVLHTVLSSWYEQEVEEAKVHEWIARSVWGTGVSDGWFVDGKVSPFNELEELTAFYELDRKPQIGSDVAVWQTLGSMNVFSIAANGGLPEDTRRITVTLPGWKPQVSRYEIVQDKAIGKSKVINDPALVGADGQPDAVVFDTSTLGAETRVRFWPNYFSNSRLVLEADS